MADKVYRLTFRKSDGTEESVEFTAPQGEKGEKGDPGEKGDRGTGILKITTAPSSYTTAIGSYTPKYRIATATVISQSGVSEVRVGDILQYSYYQYAVDHLDSTYAYISKTRTSIRGATGAAGSAGADGKSAYAYAQDGGYTGTEAEFAGKLADDYVKSVNGTLPDENGDVVVTAKAEQPNFVDSVEEMTDTTKAYVLKSTGEIWTYQSYEKEASKTPNFTNLFDKSKVLVNHAYSNNSSIVAVPSDTNSLSTGHYVTGPYVYDFTGYDITAPSTVRIKGGVDTKNTYSRIVYYRYTVPTDLTADAARTYKQFNAHVAHTTDADGVLSFPLGVNKDGTAVHGELAYFEAFALSFKLSGSAITIDDVPDLIITIDEEITYTETPGGTFYEWRSTGMSYNGADYEPRIIALEENVADLKTRVGNLEAGGGSVVVAEEAEETIYTDFACENDFTIVGDEIWGSKNESTYTRIVRHKIVNGVLTKLGEIKMSDVVHLNTLDYCPENDCLITGNGANDQNTEGNCFWIIPNASNLPNLTGTLSLADIAIQYDVDIGYKVQAIWGDGNLGQHNLVYLLSNDDEVRRAIIHKNADGSFANTYTIVGDVFTITGASGYQGADYYGGYLYFGFGGTNFVLAKVNTKDFTAVVTEYPYCTADGTAIKGVFQGVAVDKDYLWLYPNGITDGNYLVKYTR